MWDKGPVAQGVASRLQGMIRSGELKAGDKLPSQRVLSEQLRVSRPTLREALLTLETLGLIQTLPARGTFVLDRDRPQARPTWRYDDAHDLADVFHTRMLIEGEICALAARGISDETLNALNAAAETFERAWHDGDLVGHVAADLALHQGIADACPNRMLAGIYAGMQHLLSETQRQPIPNTDPDRMRQSIAEHQGILKALETRNPIAARAAMLSHIQNTARCAGVLLD
ncbi:FadR/GntR family transcriptional regulator [Paracoccus sp. T5]|uniref:FadR/GntR family transcriptional regulator n=1 Tax=Paracoccus sp. T5 TaxID=3402161 RepID=UPI003AEB8880